MIFYTVQEQGDMAKTKKPLSWLQECLYFQKTLIAGTLMKNGRFSGTAALTRTGISCKEDDSNCLLSKVPGTDPMITIY